MKRFNTGLLVGELINKRELKENNGWMSIFFEVKHVKEWKKDGEIQSKQYIINLKADNDDAVKISMTPKGSDLLINYHLESYVRQTGTGIFNNISIVCDSVEILAKNQFNNDEDNISKDTPF